MNIDSITNVMPDYANDTKVNLGKLLCGDHVQGLTLNQVYGIALACAFATKSSDLIVAVIGQVSMTLSEQEVYAAKLAATRAAMNNTYYRFIDSIDDTSYQNMPAELCTNALAHTGKVKQHYELMSLAVSVINGCPNSINAHEREVTKDGVSKLGVRSAIRIASVLNAAAQTLVIEQHIIFTKNAEAA